MIARQGVPPALGALSPLGPRSLLGLLVAVSLPAVPGSASEIVAQEVPRVRVIATGGTIAGRSQGGQLTGAQLVEAVPQLADVASIDVEEFSRIGSSGMTPDHWFRLSLRITELFREDPGLAGVVVTHGTDTMEETGYFLHLTVPDDRPVVMVGSMRNASAVSADGPANLLAGVRVAASPEARGRGVLVVLNDRIHSARDFWKSDSNRVETFVSEWGPLGVVDADRIEFRRRITTRHTTESELSARDATDLSTGDATGIPVVPIVADYAGNDGSIVQAWLERGADAIVVQAFGGGRASPGMRRAVAQAAAAGIPVVLASRVPEGRVLASAASPDDGLLSAGDLPPHKVRVLLMLALLEGRDGSDLQRLLDTH